MSVFPLLPGLQDPLRVAKHAVGQNFAHVAFLDGSCARCRADGKILPIDTVVSRNFTAWDGLDAAAKGFCETCAWGYSDPTLRTRPILITVETAHVASRDELRRLLSHPLTNQQALTLPVSGKKHLLPNLEWGCVASDDGSLLWSDDAAALMTTLLTMRGIGATEKDLLTAAPPAHLLLSSYQAQARQIFSAWETMNDWRGTPYWDVAVKASRPTLPTDNDDLEPDDA